MVPENLRTYFNQKILSSGLLARFTRIKVNSHPRSGTHFLEAFLARNFYQKDNLHVSKVSWGHWANRQIKTSGNPYGKLFGHHEFPTASDNKSKKQIIYIYRDPRAVAYSIWKTNNFIHPRYSGISFSDFLRLKLDWWGSPGNKSEEKWNIGEHWFQHVHSWHQVGNPNLMIIRYEDLKDYPENLYYQILRKFFRFRSYLVDRNILKKYPIDRVSKPVGLLPNAAQKDAWREAFTLEDEQFLLSQIPNSRYLAS